MLNRERLTKQVNFIEKIAPACSGNFEEQAIQGRLKEMARRPIDLPALPV